MSGDGKTSPERDQTDESLRVERQKADRALAEGQAVVEQDADLVLLRAREAADAVLVVARDKEDQRLVDSDPDLAVGVALAEERDVADEALRDERAAADESLRQERDAAAGALSRLVPIERDKTDRYLLTERVRSDDALAVRDDFLGIVSHDLRNLLGGIVMSAALLESGGSEGEEGRQRLVVGTKRIQRYAARMNRLIGDLVDIASIDAGKLSVTPVAGNATALVAEAVETFQAVAAAKSLSLGSELGARPLLAELDHDRMLQVLANLLSNAIKFTDPGGRIVIQGEQRGSEVRLCVVDSGAGIPSAMLESIFERFWQVGKNDRRGVGLGLYISRCIVEAHGGRIWAESTLGGGTRVSFTLRAST